MHWLRERFDFISLRSLFFNYAVSFSISQIAIAPYQHLHIARQIASMKCFTRIEHSSNFLCFFVSGCVCVALNILCVWNADRPCFLIAFFSSFFLKFINVWFGAKIELCANEHNAFLLLTVNHKVFNFSSRRLFSVSVNRL